MEKHNNSKEENNNIMNKTFENKNNVMNLDNQNDSHLINPNNDVKAQTLSIFGINKNKLLDINENSINHSKIMRPPQFELETIYRERLLALYKNKSKEELLNYFIDSEVNNILLRKEIEKNKLNKVKLENKIMDIQYENNMIKKKIKTLMNDNNYQAKYINNKEKLNNEENNLSLPNSSFVQKELNIHAEYNNMDIDGLLINN